MLVTRQASAILTTFGVRVKLEIARPEDAAAIATLRTAATAKLTETYGTGVWSGSVTETGVQFTMRQAKVFVLHQRGKIIATLTLGAKKPWAIDRKYFSKCERPVYLTAMAVAPEYQRQGIGKLCVAAALTIAKDWPADAIFLDAYDSAGGAGEFYRRCGFREVGRAAYRGVPLIYFEKMCEA
ncbi:MAG TPA: N-acetyltransferase [Verrucomicrobiae bacterium]|jgi:ribosomal protein S18 acetylase RimI-like enzyme